MNIDLSAHVVTDTGTNLAALLQQLATQLGLQAATVAPGTKVAVSLACLPGVSGS
jgi:hypothetical protein